VSDRAGDGSLSAFDSETLRKLDQLALVAQHVRVGRMKGDRRSRRKGSSVEFADYRNYVHGDDLRRLDWNVFARLQKPFIKLLEEEEDLAVHIVVDGSESMNWPPESIELQKSIYATRVAAAIGYIALSSGDLLTVTWLDGGGGASWGPSRGKHNTTALFTFLDQRAPSGEGSLGRELRAVAQRGWRPGMFILISDLLATVDYLPALSALQSKGHELTILHLLSPDEIAPEMSGDLRLIDVENGASAEVSLDSSAIQQYRSRLEQWRGEISAHSTGRGIHYVPISTEMAWDQLVLRTLRQEGVLK